MTPNPNPSPELREAFDERARELFINNGGKHSSNCVTAWQLFQEFSALSPQTLPAPGEVEAEPLKLCLSDRERMQVEWADLADHLAHEAAALSPTLATVAAANDEGVADYPDELLDRVAEAITRAQCPGREGPYGGYDYGHRHEDDLPRDGRYVVRDFRDVTSEAFGAWVHQTPDVAVHEAAFDRLTKRHIARAALDAAARLATSRSQHEGAE